MKTDLNGRGPQIIKSGVSQQVLMESFSNFELKPRVSNRSKNLKLNISWAADLTFPKFKTKTVKIAWNKDDL